MSQSDSIRGGEDPPEVKLLIDVCFRLLISDYHSLIIQSTKNLIKIDKKKGAIFAVWTSETVEEV